MTARKYGYIRDTKDSRDIIRRPKLGPIRPYVERLGLGVVRIEDQGQLGSCTGQSSTAAVEIAMGWKTRQLSRLMAYYLGREIENNVANDDGAMIRDVVKGLVATGAASESWWPYRIERFAKKPSPIAYLSAARTRRQLDKAGIVYERVVDRAGLLQALNDGHPVIFGFQVIQEFECLPPSGFLRLPVQGEESLGGHAVVAVGYDIAAGYVWVQNSWGKGFGIDGYFKMDLRYFDRPDLVNDMWLVRKAKATA